MEENTEIVSLKLAKLARQKGFNLRCDNGYCFDTDQKAYYTNHDPGYFVNDKLWKKHFAAPKREELNQWLRANGIFITVEVDQTFEPKFCFNIATFDKKTYEWNNYDPTMTALYYTYEKALEDGLEEALKLL